MYTLPKYARLGTTSDSFKKGLYDVTKLDAAVSRGDLKYKDSTYLKPITVHVIGCGDTPPADHDPESRGRIEADDSLDRDTFLNEVDQIADIYGEKALATIINNGLNLDPRSGAFDEYKKSQRKMSDMEKAGWILSNRPDEVKPNRTLPDYVRLYDQIHNGSN